uniref:C-type lectin domain family 2 member A n=2 Tax=Bos TaxID=9903 RepID=G3N0Y6_BOVIN
MTSSYTSIYLPEEAPSVEAVCFHQCPCLHDEMQALPASTGDAPREAVLCLISSESAKAMECSEEWIGVRRKCFYFSDDTRNWTASKRFCNSQGSELAQIDTPEDMKFLKKHAGTSMYWIGLSRKLGESWKWTNGTTFNAGFEISGNGPFAFLNSDGVHSSRGFVDIKWICSKPISKT